MIAALLVPVVFTACAQKLDASKIPPPVKTSFEKKYPGVPGKWEKEDGNYEVNFKQGGTGMSMVIKPDGTIAETETDIKVSELPVSAQNYVKEHYKGKTIKESARITKEDGTVNYEAEVGGKDVLFDADGKFIKEVND